jgi:hypothetical protein
MANPPASAQYGLVADGVSRTLQLTFGRGWTIVNSNIDGNPISGSYDPTTGKITFVEQFIGALPQEAFTFPSYYGYYFTGGTDPVTSGLSGIFAGIYDQTILVGGGPGGLLQWKRIENAWRAQQLVQPPPAPGKKMKRKAKRKA